jgi:hypothetical protein
MQTQFIILTKATYDLLITFCAIGWTTILITLLLAMFYGAFLRRR